jgi:hypothetical protein
MLNRLEDLEKEDLKYNLHVGAETPETYNLTLIYPMWKPPVEQRVNLKTPEEIKSKLAKLGIVR